MKLLASGNSKSDFSGKSIPSPLSVGLTSCSAIGWVRSSATVLFLSGTDSCGDRGWAHNIAPSWCRLWAARIGLTTGRLGTTSLVDSGCGPNITHPTGDTLRLRRVVDRRPPRMEHQAGQHYDCNGSG